MTEAFYFLIDTVFTLYLMVMLLRLWLQMARADFYNPFSQFVVKATNPLVLPLRRVLPSLGSLDTATLVLAFLIAMLKVAVMQLLMYGMLSLVSLPISGVLLLVKEIFSLLFWVIIIRAILSWVSQGNNPVEYLLHQLTEPLLRPIRRVIPPLGGFDLSVLVLLIGLQFLQILFQNLISVLLR